MTQKFTPLPKETIDEIFVSATDQHDYEQRLYAIALPDITGQIDGYPIVSPTTYDYIHAQAIRFDRMHHADVIAGGLWMSRGFEVDSNMPDWAIDPSKCYKATS